MVLENGQIYDLTEDALNESQSDLEAEQDLLIIENEAGPWKDQRLALASLQRVKAVSKSMGASGQDDETNSTAFLTFALRS